MDTSQDYIHKFHPTKERIISCYLHPKILQSSFTVPEVPEVDFTKCEPWDLPGIATTGEGYFFSLLKKKHPKGSKMDRSTQTGYWKAVGRVDKIKIPGVNLAGKKTLQVFHRGKYPNGEKSNWYMHEYRLDSELPNNSKDEWVIAKVFVKSDGASSSSSAPPR